MSKVKNKRNGFQVTVIQKPKEFGKDFVGLKEQIQNMMKSRTAINSRY